MSKAIVYVTESLLKGVFSNKKLLWDKLEQDENVDNLIIKLSPTKHTNIKYSKVVKYLKDRSMLRIYKKEDIIDYESINDIESCPTYIKLWETEMNKEYNLVKH